MPGDSRQRSLLVRLGTTDDANPRSGAHFVARRCDHSGREHGFIGN